MIGRTEDQVEAKLTERQRLCQALRRESGGRIVLIVADGLGGLPIEPGGPTELEKADTPNLDRLAEANTCGLIDPVARGITCGSGPGHLALFGYDPLAQQVGRGVLSALGIGFDLTERDVALRGNLACFDEAGKVCDRRAGRISTREARPLIEALAEIELDAAEVFVEPVRDHRFCLVLRGDGLHGDVSDTDPQVEGAAPNDAQAASIAARPTADLINAFADKARQRLRAMDSPTANGVLLRGAGKLPVLPTIPKVYGLSGAASAVVPMYRGVARLLGIELLDHDESLSARFSAVIDAWDDHDLFFLHDKTPDKRGEDGDFDGRVEALELLDAQIGRLVPCQADVLIVTGDHSTPARLGGHSWHPVPVLLAAETCRPDAATTFGEAGCLTGGLGRFDAGCLMTVAMAHAGRLNKFGA